MDSSHLIREKQLLIKKKIDEWADLYWDDISRYAYSLAKNTSDAEDLTQRAFIRTWELLRKKPDYQIGEARAWLKKIAKNEFLNDARKKKNHTTDSLDQMRFARGGYEHSGFDVAANHTYEPAQIFENEEVERHIKSRLAILFPHLPTRNVLMLYLFVGMKCNQIALFTCIPLSTVKNYVQRGLSELKNCKDPLIREYLNRKERMDS